MAKVTILKPDGTQLDMFDGITKIEFTHFSNKFCVFGDDLICTSYPTGVTYHLYSETASYTIDSRLVGAILVEKSDS